MKVSVVIPVYNVYHYLGECVESVRKLRTDVELVLVDDGSTDGSGELCDEMARMDRRIRVIHQENGGLSAARNTGIRCSTGDYILFLDADDFLDPVAADEMLANLDSRPELLLGLYQNFYEDTRSCEKEDCEGFLMCDGLTQIDRFLDAVPADGRSCYMIACRFVARRDFLLKHELFFLPGIYHEDEEWTQRVLCCADAVFVTHCFFYQYRQARAGAITSAVRPKHVFDTLKIMEHTSARLAEQIPDSARAQYLRRRMANLYLNNLLNLYILEPQQRGQVCEELLRYRKSCVPCLSGGIGRAVGLCDRIFGFRFTCFALRMARKLKK